jgi:TctA family transporter
MELGSLIDNVASGLATAVTLTNLLYCVIGVTLGTFLGVLPGIGGLVSLSLLFPITFHLEPTAALIMLAGIVYGTTYGGSTASILLNVPGTPSSAVACIEGYPMSKQGRAGVALFITTIVSFVGGSIGILLMMLFAPVIAAYALRFGPAEYFSLIVLGLIAASTISTGSPIKGIATVILGVCFGLVGVDTITGAVRYTFGVQELYDGISLLAVAMGLFGVAEVIVSVRTVRSRGEFDRKAISLRSMIPTGDDMRRSTMPILRGAGIGSFLGTLPGAGGLIASFMSYAVEKRLARDPSRFGKGAIEGLAGPESANSAADGTAFIPTLTLGIPGSASMAIILGVLLIHGITPGPALITDRPQMFWGLIMSFWIGNLLLLIINIPLIGIWLRLLAIPYHLLYPAVLVFVCAGVFTVANNPVEVWLVALFGLVGYVLRYLDFPLAPMILGFVLGPLLEQHFRRSLVISRGDFVFFIERPISGTIIATTILLLLWVTWSTTSRRRRASESGPL